MSRKEKDLKERFKSLSKENSIQKRKDHSSYLDPIESNTKGKSYFEEKNKRKKLTEKISSFEELDLKEDILKGIYYHGFTKPSAIQKRALRPIIARRDVIAQSQSGTGKTGTFAIGCLQLIDEKRKVTQCLILSPTRELAKQTERVIASIGDFLKVTVRACIGGTNVGDDVRALDAGAQIVSGTPGRVFDMISRGNLRTENIKVLVIDESDEMLNQGFKKQIYDIYRLLKPGTQVVLTSATLPGPVIKMAETFMTDPIKILVKRDEVALQIIKQFFIGVEKEELKFETLCDLYNMLTITQAVIFCNLRKKVEELTKELKKRNFAVTSMHGEMTQSERDAVMQEFRSGQSRILIATDIWARGIDVPQVSLVINYDLPLDKENYIHRIGRSGRFGRKGVAINFVTDDDVEMLRDIEHYYSIQIDEMPQNINQYL